MQSDKSNIPRPPKPALNIPRPPHSFLAMIRMAIEQSPGRRMTVEGLQSWIENSFPYYQQANKRWLSEVPTALSRNPCFAELQPDPRKQNKESFWTLDPYSGEQFRNNRGLAPQQRDNALYNQRYRNRGLSDDRDIVQRRIPNATRFGDKYEWWEAFNAMTIVKPEKKDDTDEDDE